MCIEFHYFWEPFWLALGRCCVGTASIDNELLMIKPRSVFVLTVGVALARLANLLFPVFSNACRRAGRALAYLFGAVSLLDGVGLALVLSNVFGNLSIQMSGGQRAC